MSDALPLPPRPNLEQYKKLAKDFQQACKSDDPTAIRNWAAQWAENLARLDGQARDETVPAQVAFSYVDFDFYDPIKDALEFLDTFRTAVRSLFR